MDIKQITTSDEFLYILTDKNTIIRIHQAKFKTNKEMNIEPVEGTDEIVVK